MEDNSNLIHLGNNKSLEKSLYYQEVAVPRTNQKWGEGDNIYKIVA